MIMAILTLLHN